MFERDLTEEQCRAARAEAARDWAAGKAKIVTFGNPGLRPGIDEETGLWWTSMGCMTSEMDYWGEYNDEVCRHLAEHGLPPWAPVNRVADVDALLEAFERTGVPLPRERSDDRRREISHVLGAWPVEPVALGSDDANGVQLLGGNVSADCGRIDIIDLEPRRWMATVHVERTEEGFPWDRFCDAQERARIFAPEEVRRRERIGKACADCDRDSVHSWSLPTMADGFTIDTDSPEYLDSQEWTTCSGDGPRCGWLCPQCYANHLWESMATVGVAFERRPGATADVVRGYVSTDSWQYVVTRQGHELVIFADAIDDVECGRFVHETLELAVVLTDRWVAMFVSRNKENWRIARFHPAFVHPEDRVDPAAVLDDPDTAVIRLLLIERATREVRAVREIQLPDEFRRALATAHRELAARPWPGWRLLLDVDTSLYDLCKDDRALGTRAFAWLTDGPEPDGRVS